MPCSYPEAARERDLHRYYRPWLDAQSLVDTDGSGEKGLTYDGYRPKTSRDKSLTAFAQLATLRLNARRAMVSLIDSHRQYILAEATKTLSLLSPKAEKPEDEVWLGNVILNKTDAVCYHTFTSTYATKEENGDTFVAECMVVPDCRLDPRFADRDYVKGEPGVRFYAGVPIITKAGYRIGVYAISDESPREGLSAAEVRFMQDVASAVMEHLELAKDSLDRSKGERMVRGLTQFIEHSATTDMQDSSTRPTTLERQTENVRLGALEEDQAHVVAHQPHRQPSQKRETESEINRIFQRAARIMRSSTEADGVVFFDTSTAGIKVHLHDTNPNAVSSDESGTHNTTTDFDTGDSTTTTRRRRGKSEAMLAETGNADASHSYSKPCPVVGLSLREGVASLVHTDFTFTEATMERYIHRYPYGKFFNYNEEGHGINSSDEKSERSETDQSDRTQTSPTGPRRPRKRRERFIPTEFLKVLPNVRTLIFLPLWDSASERWVAGGFIWTTQAGRLMSPENELPYLQAFGNSITNEVARRTAQKADRAKTTFIASISHELRSPLHGILGSVEFLRETDTTSYQQSLVASIDTCGRTLLDTIDHVLDYAKINKLRSTNARRKQRTEGRTKRQPADNSILGVTADFDLAQLVEEVCDTVCTGHTFRKTHNISGSAIYDQAESVGSQSLVTSEPIDTTVVEGRDTHGSVVVSLHVQPAATWVVRSQPGALRRIVMNLLGNSLKYTDSGFIAIHLMQSGRSMETGQIELTLTVEDSGRGMSPEYQRTKLFSPFSQEDPFSSGTGLGLSIVKQIVESFKGEIDVDSTIHVGTAIGVSMRLPIGTSSPDHDRLRAPMELRGQGVSIACEPDTRGADRGVKTRESMHLACQGLKMDITDEKNVYASIAEVDFLLTDSPSLDQLIHSPCANRINKNPLSVVCVCTDTAERTAMENRLGRQIEALSWVAEVVTQPCGPRKLARALLACQKRATQHEAERSLTRSVSDMSVQQTNSLTIPPPTQRTVSETYSQELLQQQQQAADAHAQAHAGRQQSGGDTSAQDSPPLPLALPKTITPTSPLRSVDTGEYFSPRVLLVDDNAINLKLLVVFAQRQQLRYISASNGLDAYETYRTEALSTTPPTRPFDFVLMDLSMPVMDGLTSTRQIRAFEAREGIPRSTIVALTGLASERDQKDAQEAGVDMYLVKPVKFADIKRVFGGKV